MVYESIVWEKTTDMHDDIDTFIRQKDSHLAIALLFLGYWALIILVVALWVFWWFYALWWPLVVPATWIIIDLLWMLGKKLKLTGRR